MFNTNGFDATLIQNNRNTSSIYDDQDKTEVSIKVCPYNVDQAIKFGVYTIPEAKGYFIVKHGTDVREGDEIVFNNHTYVVLYSITKLRRRLLTFSLILIYFGGISKIYLGAKTIELSEATVSSKNNILPLLIALHMSSPLLYILLIVDLTSRTSGVSLSI